MSRLEVISPGILTLLQDTGRFGYGHLGMAQGGALDLQAYCWANHLLGNSMDCPQLEITLGQAAFKAHDDMLLALTGADMRATVDGVPLKPWQTFELRRGQILKFQFATEGMRAYLATPSGFNTQKTFGSAATVTRDKLGGLMAEGADIGEGMPLQSGDWLQVEGSKTTDSRFSKMVPADWVPKYGNSVQLRVIESYQQDQFSAQQKQQFYNSTFTISPDSNRMGCRLKGNPVLAGAQGIISEGIALGAIQIPPDGQPVILMNDRQTLGGYSKLGCVARMDLPKLAQARPGQQVQFVSADHQQLLSELKKFMKFFSL
ncbi:5-oxoprolinase subunit C family protein [Spongorhabdus nitratireducens]